MSLSFDISQEELQIFLSEVDEHLQTLDEILIRMERLENDPERLQAAFRAAHTLKGMSGMIGHHRMVSLTHSLEAAFDGIRKNQIDVSSALIDLCLDAVDGLRLLQDEVTSGEESSLDLVSLVNQFEVFIADTQAAKNPSAAAQPVPANPPLKVDQKETSPADDHQPEVIIRAEIEPHSIASAARAFQIMLALQEMGTITEMEPSQAVIDTAAPVKSFYARLKTDLSVQEINRVLSFISDVIIIPPNSDSEENAGPTPVGVVEQDKGSIGVIQPIQKKNGNRTMPVGTNNKKNGKKPSEMTVRTSVERLDALMNLVGELITDRNRLSQLRSQMETERRGDTKIEMLSDTVTHLSRITDQLQEEVTRIRMLPISNVFHKFPRLVRDLSQRTGKKIDLTIRGEDTELDRSVIEEINDPLIHLIRNSIDHGIEPPSDRVNAGKPEVGKILLAAWHEQGRIVLNVEDDGRGIDTNRLRASAVSKGFLTEEEARAYPDDKAIELIFLSGLTTASTVTDISGRGVGMDIVRNNIQKVNGTISVSTTPGKGSQFQITLPLTLAIVPTLLVKVSNSVFALPIVMVAETMRLTDQDIKTVQGCPVTILRGNVLPLIHITDMFALPKKSQNQAYTYVVVVNHGKQRVGLMVDAFMGEQEVVVKSLGNVIGEIPGVSSAAILGDGSIALIIDVPGLVQLANLRG